MDKLAEHASKSQRCLIVSNGCGSGHIEATKCVERTLKTHKVGMQILKEDVLELVYSKKIAKTENEKWNIKQKNEDIKALNTYLKYQWVDNFFGSIISFFSFLIYLVKNNIDHVITTQPVALKGLIRAVRIINFVNSIFHPSKDKIKVGMVLTELPNEQTQNFFYGISKLFAADKRVLTLFTTNPCIKNDQEEETFWKKNTGLSLKDNQVVYDSLPIRPAFYKIALQEKENKYNNEKPIETLQVRCSSENERKAIYDCTGIIEEPLEKTTENQEKLNFTVNPNDQVITVMLGGQAAIEASKSYVNIFLEIEKNSPVTTDNKYLFIFCGRARDGEEGLFQQICSIVKEKRENGEIPPNFHVVPLTYQEDTEIAPLLSRSDISITKSGGSTAFEVQTVAKGKVLIHAADHQIPDEHRIEPKKMTEAQYQVVENTLLKYGMCVWEAGNAKYLMKTKRARIITPDTLKWNFTELLSKESPC